MKTASSLSRLLALFSVVAVLGTPHVFAGNGAPGVMTAGAIGLSLKTAETTARIRQAEMEMRATTLTAVDSKVDATESSVERLQRTARHLEGGVRDRAKTAFDEVRAKEKAVRSSLKEARRAGAEEWSEAREHLAANYEAYAQAVASAEASIGAVQVSGSAQATRSLASD